MIVAASALTYIVPVVLFVVFFAILYSMANSRGRNPIVWGIFGGFFFLIALIAILIAGKTDEAARVGASS